MPGRLKLAGNMYALSIRGLTKTYKNGVHALKGVDLDVEKGDFFALLGPNGAGKTTLIGILTSLVNKSGGTVSVFGHDLDRELEAAKACIGIGLWGAAVVGYLAGPLAVWERVAAFAAGLLLIIAMPITDEAGLALAAIVVGQHLWRRRKGAAALRSR